MLDKDCPIRLWSEWRCFTVSLSQGCNDVFNISYLFNNKKNEDNTKCISFSAPSEKKVKQ